MKRLPLAPIVALVAASLLSLPATALQEARPKRAPVTFVPQLLRYFCGEELPDAALLAPDGSERKLSQLRGKRAIVALLPPVELTNDEWPPSKQLFALSKRFGKYDVQSFAIVNWMAVEDFKSAASASKWPIALYGDPAGVYSGPETDLEAIMAHKSSTFMGRLFQGGMTPALPSFFALDAQGRVLGQFFVRDDPALAADGLANLLLHSGVKLAPEDMPAVVAPPEAFVKPPPREPEAAVELIKIGAQAPDFTMRAADGSTVKLSDFRGKIVVLDFWATWCGPCRAALPHVNEVAAQYRDQDVIVLASCTNDGADPFDEFLEKEAPKFPGVRFLYDPAGKSPERASRKLYGVSGIPQQFVIDRNGVIVAGVDGYMKGEVLLDAALAKAGVKVPEAILEQAAADLRKREELRKEPEVKKPIKIGGGG